MKQTTFASMTYQMKKKRTRRGRPPMPLESKLRICFMQRWYAMSDPGMEDALYEIESMRR